MTGPEHYRMAEALLADADKGLDQRTAGKRMGRYELIEVAQVHATLALAEAYVAGAVMRPEDRDEWDRATGRSEAAPAGAGQGED